MCGAGGYGCVRWIRYMGADTRTPRGAVAHRGVSVCPYAECRGDGNAGLTAVGHFAVFLLRGIFLCGGIVAASRGERLATHSPWVFSREGGRNAGSRVARRPRYCRTTRLPRVLARTGARGFLRGCLWAWGDFFVRGNRGGVAWRVSISRPTRRGSCHVKDAVTRGLALLDARAIVG